MTKGKSTCKLLKDIRQQIADANGISYQPKECHYEGDCAGTCPACEAEIRYLETQLRERKRLSILLARQFRQQDLLHWLFLLSTRKLLHMFPAPYTRKNLWVQNLFF